MEHLFHHHRDHLSLSRIRRKGAWLAYLERSSHITQLQFKLTHTHTKVLNIMKKEINFIYFSTLITPLLKLSFSSSFSHITSHHHHHHPHCHLSFWLFFFCWKRKCRVTLTCALIWQLCVWISLKSTLFLQLQCSSNSKLGTHFVSLSSEDK